MKDKCWLYGAKKKLVHIHVRVTVFNKNYSKYSTYINIVSITQYTVNTRTQNVTGDRCTQYTQVFYLVDSYIITMITLVTAYNMSKYNL